MKNINANNQQTYSISQLADEFEVTPRSIRHYEQKKNSFPQLGKVLNVFLLVVIESDFSLS
ncbi:MAG: MerR family transcriptional regulator [Enterobacterales bacterium]|nr:MerR family transcriptional regulator [Enterobacterales bacterium]